MTQENKELLLVDICGRLSYGVKVFYEYVDDLNKKTYGYSLTLNTWCINELEAEKAVVKPYLRPMSSMTEEEFVEYHHIKYNKVTYRDKWKRIDVGKYHNVGIIPIEDYLDWLNAHHFDFRNLIERGLAIEAPADMYKIN